MWRGTNGKRMKKIIGDPICMIRGSLTTDNTVHLQGWEKKDLAYPACQRLYARLRSGTNSAVAF